MSKIRFTNRTVPAAAPAGTVDVYTDIADKHFKQIDDTGLVVDLTAATGVTTLVPVGISPNANAGTIASALLTLQPADATNPGVLTVAAQVIGGAKTFNADTLIAQATASKATIGNAASTAVHQINGGQRATIRAIAASFVFDTTTSDQIILCNQVAPITVTLPAHLLGRRIRVVDISVNAMVNTITLVRNGGAGKIHGLSASYIMETDGGSKGLVSDGTDWWIE